MTASVLVPLAAFDIPAPLNSWPMIGIVAALGGVAAILLLWWLFGPGPTRKRQLKRATRLLRDGQWRDALIIVQKMQQGRPSPSWQSQLRKAEGECLRIAGVQAVQAKDFEKALEHHRQAAELLGLNVGEVRSGVIEKMLAEVRALFAASNGNQTAAVHAMIDRVRNLHDPFICPEASFWQGLCFIRERKWDEAKVALEAARVVEEGVRGQGSGARENAGSGQWAAGSESTHRSPSTTHHPPPTLFIDPPLYLGGILLRQGQAKEALRHISDANRAAGSCPWIALHLGMAMVAAGADGHLAARALYRALGPRGLPLWLAEPDKAWIDGLPENASFVRKLAAAHQFTCPLWGSDIRILIRQGQLALGQAYFRIGDYKSAAEAFQKLLDDSAPTHDALRWLGLALAQQERYQEAFKHLKTALDLEEPKDPLTAAYLALCAARGKPDRPEDKGPNVAWAIRTIRQHALEDPGREWIGLLNQVFGEALRLNMALGSDDLQFLCDRLVSVEATDPDAALAYHQLAAEHPALLKPEHAWLYCRAATQLQLDHEHSLELFARTFGDEANARAYFTQHDWDFDDLEYAYLRLAANTAPGAFPVALGPDYAARGEAFLLDRSERMENANNAEGAMASADILLRLAPSSPRAHDCLARLWFRGGRLDRSAEILQAWCDIEPGSWIPWARLAIVRGHQCLQEECLHAIDGAIHRADEKTRAGLCCLSARLVLANSFPGIAQDAVVLANADEHSFDSTALPKAHAYVEQALQAQPNHIEALWLNAAIFATLNDRGALAQLSPVMEHSSVADSRFHYFAALSHLAAGRYSEASSAANQAEAAPELKVEADYLAGLAKMHAGDSAQALSAFRSVAEAQGGQSSNHARAIQGVSHFRQGDLGEAISCWQALDPSQRTQFGLDNPLQQTLLLAGLQALSGGEFEQAAERFREAGKAGLRERRLGELIRYALIKSGQRLLMEQGGAGASLDGVGLETAARHLEQALHFGTPDPQGLYMLAMVRKRQGKTADARAALRKISSPDPNVLLQLGLLSFIEGRFTDAEQEFGRAWEADRSCFAAGYDLMLARLCQGDVGASLALVRQIKPLAVSPSDRKFLELLEPLLEMCAGPSSATQASSALLANMSANDEQRLLEILVGLGKLEAIFPLFQALASARPSSQPAQKAYALAVLTQAKALADRCHWDAAARLLEPFAEKLGSDGASASRLGQDVQTATYNLLGCCQCMLQEYDRGVDSFSRASKLSPNDPWLQQNLALAWELNHQIDQADGHWNRYFDLQGQSPVPPVASYRESLAFEGLTRLADVFSKADRWNTAVTYLQRACRIRPGDFDALERLFHMYNQVKRPQDACLTLQRLRELRPGDAQLELYDLDLFEVKTLADIEKMLAEIRKTLSKHPGDIRVEEKATYLVGTVTPLIRRLADQYMEQLNRVTGQMRRLPQYQINWSAVQDVMSDLQREFQRLRRVAGRCLSMTTGEDQRRVIRDLIEQIDKKLEMCQQAGA